MYRVINNNFMVKILDKNNESLIVKIPLALESHIRALLRYEKVSDKESASLRRTIASNKRYKNKSLSEIKAKYGYISK